MAKLNILFLNLADILMEQNLLFVANPCGLIVQIYMIKGQSNDFLKQV